MLIKIRIDHYKFIYLCIPASLLYLYLLLWMKLIWLLLHNLGESRGFAFVEFSSIDEAREWIEAEQVYTHIHMQS